MLPIRQIEDKIKYVFSDKDLLTEAFTHSSYANEKKIRSNEQMEFLGDAVLDLIVSRYLFDHYRNEDEGVYSQARAFTVSTTSLAKATNELGLNKYLLLGVSQKNSKITSHNKIDANLFEAVLCAIYLDGGMFPATKFVLDNLLDEIEVALQQRSSINSKSALQEYAHKHKLDLEYHFVSQSGPDHNPTFNYQVTLGEKSFPVGSGNNKTTAQSHAAKIAFDIITKQIGE